MKAKRAVIEVQFNWIFIMIVGALILFFFITIVTKQKDVSNSKLASELLTDLELIMTGQRVSVGRADIIETPDIEIDLTCDDYSIYGVSKRTGNNIMFAPTKIKGDQIVAWTLDWSVPYRISNIVYLTSTDMKYYLVYAPGDSENLVNKIKDILPSGLNFNVVAFSDLNNLRYENNYMVRFIYFQTNPPSKVPPAFTHLADNQVSGLYMSFDNIQQPEYTIDITLNFLRKEGDDLAPFTDSSGDAIAINSAGKEMVYGGMFTDDFDFYFCNLMKGFSRMQLVATVYANRSSTLSQQVGVNCKPFFLASTFDDIASEIPEILTPHSGALGHIFTAAGVLETLNENAILNSCPALY